MSTRGRRHFDVVVVGTSAGGLEALCRLLAPLPESFPSPVVVVQHLREREDSILAALLASRTKLPVVEATDKLALAPGTVVVAPPSYHLLIEADGTVSLDADTPVHFCRPAIDPLFASAAEAFGAGVLAVVLTGANRDGAEGAAAVLRRGGVLFVETPETAAFPMMPRAALERTRPDLVAPVADLASALARLTC